MKLTISVAAGAVMAFGAMAATPAHSRFMQSDPIGYEDGMNLYA